MSIQLINTSVLNEDWKVVGATTTKTVLVQSKPDENITNCRFSLRLRYGVEGLETPIYSQEINTYLEPNQARLIDFRELIPDDLRDGNLINSWQIESQLSFNFAPITVRYYEIDLKDAEKAFYQGQLAGKADIGHGHELADIALLETALLQKLSAPVSPPIAGQILRAIGPDAWEWSTVQFGEGGAIALPSQIVNTVNGQTGNVTIALPGLATTTTNGLLSSANFSLLTGQNAANGNVLQIVNNTPAWSPLVIPATVETWDILSADTTLAISRNHMVTGGSNFTLPSSVSGTIKIGNSRNSTVYLLSGNATFSGYSATQQRSISGLTRIALPGGATATLVGNGSVWQCLNCAIPSLVFNYNFGGLTRNPLNPLEASDLFDYLGKRAGTNNTWTNPTNTTFLTSATSAAPSAIISSYIDRSETPRTSSRGSGERFWFGWRFAAPFRCTGFWFRTWNNADSLPRAFSALVNNVSTLTTGQSITAWTTVGSFGNQTQIKEPWSLYYFSISGAPSANALAIRNEGLNSSGTALFATDQFALFGEYDE